MESFQKAGGAKSIGVSHYCEQHIDDILEIATIKPAMNQVMFHVGMAKNINMTDMPYPTKPSDQPSYKGINYEAFSSLCGPCNGTAAAAATTPHHQSRRVYRCV